MLVNRVWNPASFHPPDNDELCVTSESTLALCRVECCPEEECVRDRRLSASTLEMPRPRLRPNSFFLVLKTSEISDGFGSAFIPKLLLTNRRLHLEFFRSSEEKPLHLNAKPHGLSISKGWKTATWMEEVEFQCAVDGMIVLLRLAPFDEIRVNLTKRTVPFAMLTDFIRLCNVLRGSAFTSFRLPFDVAENRSLERIFLRFDWPKRLLNRGLVEFLPDSITRLDSDPEICPLLHRRSTVLEQLNLFVQHTDLSKLEHSSA